MSAPADDSRRLVGAKPIRDIRLWVGRDKLLSELKADLLVERRKVLVLVGQGGIGKTSLAVKLLEACGVDLKTAKLQEECPFETVLYVQVEEGTTFDGVLAEFAQGLALELRDELQPEQAIALVIGALQRSRCLLVLDNLENVLQAGRSRSPEWGQLLWALVDRSHDSQILITSQEIPKDLANPNNSRGILDPMLARLIKVGSLELGDGVLLLKYYLQREQEKDLYWIVEQVGAHPFVLNHLAIVANEDYLDGNFSNYLKSHPKLITQDIEPVLNKQLSRHTDKVQHLLKRMGILRRAVDLRGLTFLRLYEDAWMQSQNLLSTASPMDFSEAEKQETYQLIEVLVGSSLVESYRPHPKHDLLYEIHPVIKKFLRNQFIAELPNFLQGFHAFYQGKDNLSRWLRDAISDYSLKFFSQNSSDSQFTHAIIDNAEWYINKDLLDLTFYLPILARVAVFNMHLGFDDEFQHISLLLIKIQIASGVHSGDGTTGLSKPSHLKELIEWNLGVGLIKIDLGEWTETKRLFSEALDLSRKIGNQGQIARSLYHLGRINQYLENWKEAKELYYQSLKLLDKLSDDESSATVWNLLGETELSLGYWHKAQKLHHKAMEVYERLDHKAEIATSWRLLGNIERYRGNWDVADDFYQKSLKISKELNDRSGIAISLECLGRNELDRGNLNAAETLLKDALSQMKELGVVLHIAEINADLAKLYSQRYELGDRDRAQDHYEIAHQLFTRLGTQKELEQLDNDWNSRTENSVNSLSEDIQ